MLTLKSSGVLARVGNNTPTESMKASAPMNEAVNRSKAIAELISTERTFVSEMTVSYYKHFTKLL
jgi:hypothetical protein